MNHVCTPKYLQKRLAELGRHAFVAEQTGLSQASISRIAAGNQIPRLDAANAIFEFICKIDKVGISTLKKKDQKNASNDQKNLRKKRGQSKIID